MAQPENDAFLVRLWNAESVRYPAGLKGPFLADDVADVVGGDDDYRFVACCDEKPVGDILLQDVDWTTRQTELGYAIDSDESGQGYATEAADLALRHAFDGMGLHRVQAKVFEGNDASMRVLEKLGFDGKVFVVMVITINTAIMKIGTCSDCSNLNGNQPCP